MAYAICTVPAAPVRKENAHRIEMVNQLLFGEAMEILEEKEEWRRIRSLYDDYEGWLTYHQITEVDEELATAGSKYVTGQLVNTIQFNGMPMSVPMGSVLPGFNEETGIFWQGLYEEWYINTVDSFSLEQLINAAYDWLNAPYLWGGKTFMGVDCSGFVQTVFRLYGIQLKRDAYQQAEQGEAVDFSAAAEGDLAFFQNENGRITHVGLVLRDKQIIHASGKVRIDAFDETGILNKETEKVTHHLHSVRRYF